MKIKHFFHLIWVLLFLNACTTSKKTTTASNTTPKNNNYTEAVFLQLNDVYEIAPLENGKRGGLARVATVLQRLRAENPNTYAVICGDFFSPSVIGTLKYEGKSIKGRQMVDVLNHIGIDYAILGNHEFDLDGGEFQERVNESKFKWISSDINTVDNTPFAKKDSNGYFTAFPTMEIVNVNSKNGETYKIGMFSASVHSVNKSWIVYNDHTIEAIRANTLLKPKTDVNIALTHLAIKDDRALVNAIPNVPLIMGGHDHDNMKVLEGNTVITKADANAKSVYVNRVRFDNMTKQVSIISEKIDIDETIAEDPSTKQLVDKWIKIAEESMLSQGFNPNRIVTKIDGTLDGRETALRHYQCPLGTSIANSMLSSTKHNADCAFFNGGSVRIDDQVTGNLTEYDVIRIMPYGGPVVEVTMKGTLLKKVLDAGENNKGRGGYLQRTPNIAKVNTDWIVNGNKVEDTKTYTIITGSFLFSGKEMGIEFFNDKNPDVIKAYYPDPADKSNLQNDIRKLFIQYLGTKK